MEKEVNEVDLNSLVKRYVKGDSYDDLVYDAKENENITDVKKTLAKIDKKHFDERIKTKNKDLAIITIILSVLVVLVIMKLIDITILLHHFLIIIAVFAWIPFAKSVFIINRDKGKF